MKNFDPNDEDYNLWLFIAQVRAAMLRAREKEVSKYGITASQASVLFVVNALGKRATPAELGRWLFQTSQSIAGILNRMERLGLLKRVKDLDKKNQMRIVLTKKGREAFAQSSRRESMHRIMPVLPPETRQQFIKNLTRILDATLKYLGETRERPFPY